MTTVTGLQILILNSIAGGDYESTTIEDALTEYSSLWPWPIFRLTDMSPCSG